MTIKDLYKSVAQLGFESSLEYTDGFIYAANRALLQINSIRPVARSYIIDHRPLTNYLNEASFDPIDKLDSALVLCANCGKAYAFEARGKGSYIVEQFEGIGEDGKEKWSPRDNGVIDTPNKYKAYRGFIKDGNTFKEGAIRITFNGDYLITVRCAGVYNEIISDDPNDIPIYEPFTRYDMSSLVTDFLSFSEPPVSCATLNKAAYNIESNNIVLLPYNARGLYSVEYNRRPTPINTTAPSTATDVIELDEELASLMPLLVAAYIWADDEPNKASYYLDLYRERVATIEKKYISVKPVRFNDVYGGWV